MGYRFLLTPSKSGLVVIGVFAIILSEVRACGEEQSWCHSVVGVCDSESTRRLCPRTCNTCLPEICDECTQNCTTSHEGREFQCTCNVGYKLHNDGKTCIDIDECKENPRICGNEICRNAEGNFACIADECKAFLTRHYIRSYSYPEQCCKMSKGKCGQNNQNLDGRALRIYGGDNASAGMWPWHATITTKDGLCGGSLISDRWVITSAQCFRSTPNRRPVKFDVTFGSVERNKVVSHTRRRRTIIEIIKYGSFRYPMHDIALAKLDRRIQVSEFVKPVCLPNGEIPKEGTRCFSTGFGVTDPGKFQPSEVLQQVELAIVDTKSCRDEYRGSGTSVNVNTMMCAGGGNSGKSTCMGDSGGPLVCQRCNSCDWFLAGVTSFGSKCGSSNRPSVYTNVEYYENWIARWTTNAVKINKNVCRPVQWSRWGPWTPCSRTCDRGGQTRIRICSDRSATGLPGCLGNYFDRRVCNTVPCGAGPWSKWTDCSKSCGGGVQTRTTTCKTPGCKRLSERQDCNTQICPQWNSWSQWSGCSRSCGGGSRTRRRSCEVRGDAKCSGRTSATESCNEAPCPSWSDWSRWQKCSQQCGGGSQTATRSCIGGRAGSDCRGRDTREQKCNTQACQFSSWGKWTRCSVSCGPGTEERERTCPKGTCRSDEFGSTTKQTKSCNIINCVGKWSKWSLWGDCSQSCGGGLRSKNRLCTNGLTCPGEVTTQQEECNLNACVGSWTGWTDWSDCDVTCGDGSSVRSRRCSDGPDCPGRAQQSRGCSLTPCSTWSGWSLWSDCDATCGPTSMKRDRVCQHGTTCPGDRVEIAECLTIHCPSWSKWSSWSLCDSTCGNGVTNRRRTCENGPGCSGEADQSTSCIIKPCPTWSAWSSWSACTTTCGEGFTKRERSCENGPGCPGDAEQSRLCIGEPCSTWTDWSQWSPCDATCGEGNRIRTRSCENGDDCPGNPEESEQCQLKVCPSWSEWSEWTTCSSTCGNGNETRTRTCENSTSGDEGCDGDKQETKPCATEACPSQCSYLCVQRVKSGACVIDGEWMSRLCHSDCCGPAECRDELSECPAAAQAGYCTDITWFQNCVASCGYCP